MFKNLVPTALRTRPGAWALCLAALATTGSAGATPLFELTARQSQISIHNITNAFGTAAAVIDPGMVSSTSLTDFQLEFEQGNGFDPVFASNTDFLFYAELEASWFSYNVFEVEENVNGNNVVLAAISSFSMFSEGRAGFIGANGVDCEPDCILTSDHPYESRNFLQLSFTLSEATTFSALGYSTRGQVTTLQYSADGGATWGDYAGWNSFITYGGTPLIDDEQQINWSQAGTLLAGSYRMANATDGYNNRTRPLQRWGAELTIDNAQAVTSVPEPGSVMLTALGLLALLGAPGFRRRLQGR